MPYALQVQDLTKIYGNRKVVNGVTFAVEQGEIFGLLGPNGSGKTTTIRMALDIIRPDAGSVALLGGISPRDALPRVGYLPEERGLLKKEKVLEILRYLGELKGLDYPTAKDRAGEMLHRVGLHEHRNKKVEALSRGMTQLVQFAGAMLHQPEMIILDEPFSGLDPINVQMMKELIREQHTRGATVIFSTHIMSDVEELCERVVLISDGQMLLYGRLDELKRARGSNGVRVRADRHPQPVPAGSSTASRNGFVEYRFPESGAAGTPESVLRAYLDAGISLERFELMLPSLNDIFIQEVSKARGNTHSPLPPPTGRRGRG
ncbi:MAG: ATP-binding cassette domain-containing protein [Dehalococcoidia bacterium]|nr:ATP-binding cassette domain-containing protein [Dehalococcoidia bacterium]